MAEMTAEEFLQRAFDVGLLDARQMETIWSQVGRRDISTEDMVSHVLRTELLTNWQIERLFEGKRVGYVFNKYKILYLVGAGTFARVYRAVNTQTDEVVALKVLRQRYSDDLKRTEQFRREAATVMELKHPNIVAIHDVDHVRGRYYMVMEFVEGQNLRDWLRRCPRLTVFDAVRVGHEVATGLQFAASKGVYHRDLKNSNIMVSARGRAALADFGLASIEGKVTQKNLEENPNPRSIDYAGLERASGAPRDDKRSDIFFYGCTLYHMLCGQAALPEVKDRMARFSSSRFMDIKPITTYDSQLPARLVMAVHKCLELKPDDRFQTFDDVLNELTAIKSTLDPKYKTLTRVDPTGTDVVPQASPQVPVEEAVREGESRTVMVIESNIGIQDKLRERLKKLGYKVLIMANPERAMSRFEYDDAGVDCVVFGTGELGSAALDAFNTFCDRGETAHVPAIVLFDAAHKGRLKHDGKLNSYRKAIPMPLDFKKLRAWLKKLIDTKKEA